MNTTTEVMSALQAAGAEQTRRTYARHGCNIDCFGVQIGQLKKIAKQIKGNHSLAIELYETGNSDAMYLAGMVVEPPQMTKKQLDSWVKAAGWGMIGEYAVAPVAAESPHGRSLALKWMKSKQPLIAATGWTTYALLLATLPDDQLDLSEVTERVDTVVEQIDTAPNGVRYAMNNFVICVGCYVKPLLKSAKAAAKRLGKVEVDMGDTSCKVPLATEAIAKVESMDRVGKKRKSARC
ncbi:DNA alkylation repair protein [Aeoliella mucimassa]|uniref:DNA alkylation repair enzyme n=1 Tax=Aeoliella mucimassa TaxID=2527972 RepID=A0A518AJR3_9BACT|nr:DNA alkylation repair protein [Aeoliella mucimassa]QDU54963.1 DNA alkylation repair enzyme [Aeoliella mucimassa]